MTACMDLLVQQRAVCAAHGAAFFAAPPDRKVGVAENVREGIYPLNGLRHHPQGDTTG